MTRAEWSAFLYEEYVRMRALPRWPVIRDQHDDEDRRYFEMLDRERERGRIQCVA